MSTAVRCRDVQRAFGGVAALSDVTCEVATGEIFGLVGPDGAGKTTLLRILSGILAPTGGSVMVADCDVVAAPERVKHRIGYMSQRFGLYADLTVLENLHFYADLFGVARHDRAAAVARPLSFSNLTPFAQRLAGNLSGGMKQKLGLVCTLIHTPRVLLLDEPTNGVDPVARREFWHILYRLLRERVTIVFATSYLDEAERCGRVALLHDGVVLACDTPAQLKRQMQGSVLELRAAEPRTAAAILRPALVSEAGVDLCGDRVHLVTSAPAVVADRAREILRAHAMTDVAVRAVEPSLEDVFVIRLAGAHDGIGATAMQDKPTAGADALISPTTPNNATPTGAMPPAVAIDHLERRFGEFVAVNRISLTVRAGEIFRFLGPNGAGKSTTIRMLCGLLRPTSGGGTVAGYDLGTRAERIKAEIGYMSQRFSLYEDLTVEENINFYSGIYGIPRARKRERKAWALAMAGLTSRRGMRTGALAGGWKQRLALGCAILHQPRIIFLDEPTAGVDPVSRRQFWDLIYALAAQGVTIFVTTHYMDEAEYCDRIGLIYRGDLIALGTPRELKNGMAQAAVLEVRCARPAEALEELRHHPNVREAALFGSSVHVVTAADAPAADLAVWLHQRGYATARCERIAPSLEDVFVAMIEAHDRADAARKDAT